MNFLSKNFFFYETPKNVHLKIHEIFEFSLQKSRLFTKNRDIQIEKILQHFLWHKIQMKRFLLHQNV